MYEIKEESFGEKGIKKERLGGGDVPLVIIKFTSVEPVILGQELNVTESPNSALGNCWLKSGARTSESSEAAYSS